MKTKEYEQQVNLKAMYTIFVDEQPRFFAHGSFRFERAGILHCLKRIRSYVCFMLVILCRYLFLCMAVTKVP